MTIGPEEIERARRFVKRAKAHESSIIRHLGEAFEAWIVEAEKDPDVAEKLLSDLDALYEEEMTYANP